MESQILQCMVALSVAVVIGMYAATRGERVHWPVVALMAAIAIWTAGMVLRIVGAPDGGFAPIFYAYYLGAVAIAPLFLILAARLTHGTWMSPSTELLVGIPSAAAFLAAISNPFHHLYFRHDLPVLGNRLADDAGPLLWAFTGWSYVLVATGIALFIRSAIGLARSGQPMRGGAIAVAACMPIIAGFTRSIGLAPNGNDFTPIAIAISVGALFGLHWRHQMRETLPLARRDVIEHLADGVIILDDNGKILDSNPNADDIMGAASGTLRGRELIDVIADSNAVIAESDLEQAAHTAVSETSKGPWIHTFETRDGRLIESRTAEVRGGDDEPAGFFCVFRDQTDHRRMQHFLRQSQRMETMAGLSAGIAHEINNPLAYIRSNLNHMGELSREIEEQLQEANAGKTDSCQELCEVAEECSEGIDRIRGIVDRMRRFSRIDADELSEIDINEALDDALKMARLRGATAVALHYRPDDSLPRVLASHEHIVQLLLNLCSNARQAVEGVEQPSVEIETAASATDVTVCIRDNGPGIASRIRGRIFDPFFTTKAPGDGTGLGLPIAYGIAREHGGSLDFEPPASGGAQFTLRLPINRESDPDTHAD